ncbi:hypothetical protein A9Q99_12410 [Gammaproteobacteria bacterium 45_16_T64]|nr:hypothetical protein A9Q99_12410 [Gammaproteobacteria bacterium 45_16_T64]
MSTRRGFTLIELLVVVAIVAVIGAIAYPSYADSVKHSRRLDAMSGLEGLALALARYHTENGTYANAVDIYPMQTPIDSGTKYYDLAVVTEDLTAATEYILRAKPIDGTSQEGDGSIELNYANQRSWDEDGNENISDTDKDWDRG